MANIFWLPSSNVFHVFEETPLHHFSSYPWTHQLKNLEKGLGTVFSPKNNSGGGDVHFARRQGALRVRFVLNFCLDLPLGPQDPIVTNEGLVSWDFLSLKI